MGGVGGGMERDIRKRKEKIIKKAKEKRNGGEEGCKQASKKRISHQL